MLSVKKSNTKMFEGAEAVYKEREKIITLQPFDALAIARRGFHLLILSRFL